MEALYTVRLPEFTVRESDILHFLGCGYARKQIAATLHISYSTVDSHLYSIFKKTGLHSIVELMSYAQERGYGAKQRPRITEALNLDMLTTHIEATPQEDTHATNCRSKEDL